MKRFLLALVIAGFCMLAFRSLAFTIYAIEGDALAPTLRQGDHILVNRWSYGLRTGNIGGTFSYGRLFKRNVKVGDIVAFESPIDSLKGILVARCTALPGDTITDSNGLPFMLPGKTTCDPQDMYWMECIGRRKTADSRVFGPVPENLIIGKVCKVIYNHK